MALQYQGSVSTIINETNGVPTLVRYRLAYKSSVDGWSIAGDAGGDDPGIPAVAGTGIITLTKGTAVDAVKLLNYYYYTGVCVYTGEYTLDIDGVEQEGEIGIGLIGGNIGNGAAGSLSRIDATEILTNKRLTSPKLNENVVLTPTATELNLADGAVAGTPAANKFVIPDANVNLGVIKCIELHIGASGAEVKVDATPAELNVLDDFDTTSKPISISKDIAVVTQNKIANYPILVTDGFITADMTAGNILFTLPVCSVNNVGTTFAIVLSVPAGNTLTITTQGGDKLIFMTDDDTEVSWSTITMTTADDCVLLKMMTASFYLVLGGKGVNGVA